MVKSETGLLLCMTTCLSVLCVMSVPVFNGRDNEDYLRMMVALDKAKENGYLDSLYSQLYDTYDYPSSLYQDYMNELMKQREWERQMEQQLGGESEMIGSEEEIQQDLEVRENWPAADVSVGQVSGVAVDSQGKPTVFHRADRVWGDGTRLFNENNEFEKELGPIKSATLVELDPETGSILKEWGQDRFYLPHGLTIDGEGNYWMTDVGTHQVYKFESSDSEEPSLVLGEAFMPAEDNDDQQRFCKPTDVAVSSQGHIFVADGYCNRRVVKFDENGSYLGQIDIEGNENSVPHSVTLAEDLDLLCVTDRENTKILCYTAGLQSPDDFGQPQRDYSEPELSSIYAIEYNPATGLLFAISGTNPSLPAVGFTIDLHQDQQVTDVIDEWSPHNQGFDQPHDVAVSPDGNTVYVGEIFPARVWQFGNVIHENVMEQIPGDEQQNEEAENQVVEEEKEVEEPGSDDGGVIVKNVVVEKVKGIADAAGNRLVIKEKEFEDGDGHKVKVITKEQKLAGEGDQEQVEEGQKDRM